MKFKMTVDEALDYADEWNLGRTVHEDSQGWRTVCLILAEEVRRLREAMDEESRSVHLWIKESKELM